MNPGDEIPNPTEDPSLEVERLLAEVANSEQENAMASSGAENASPNEGVQAYDFRNPMLIASRELRKLRLLQEEFVSALAARLSSYLRLEFSLKLTGLQTIAYQNLAESWGDPSHLTLFKIEPLRGVSILEIPPKLGLSMVDRLMGGPGRAPEAAQEMSEIEKALLEQAVQMILSEWCSHWSKLKELKLVLLGYESSGRFIQGAPSETVMLVVKMEAGMGDCTEQIQIGLPYAALEVLIRRLSQGEETVTEAIALTPAKAASKWNPCLDDVRILVSAEWQGFELAAREVLALKVGDVLKVDPQAPQQVELRLADIPKFNGRIGTVAGKWAVELTQVINQSPP